jgi:hypothetical protein
VIDDLDEGDGVEPGEPVVALGDRRLDRVGFEAPAAGSS